MEKVYFLFIKKDKVLLEYSKDEKGKFIGPIVPNGIVKDSDRMKNLNSLEHAMHREVFEKFKGTVIPLQYELIKKISKDNNINNIFFIYAWDGDHPSYIFEDLKQSAKLRFVNILDVYDAVDGDIDKQILYIAKETVRIRGILYS